jgi:hypothetical protein
MAQVRWIERTAEKSDTFAVHLKTGRRENTEHQRTRVQKLPKESEQPNTGLNKRNGETEEGKKPK